jgi:hypothetical protein
MTEMKIGDIVRFYVQYTKEWEYFLVIGCEQNTTNFKIKELNEKNPFTFTFNPVTQIHSKWEIVSNV